MATVSVVKLKVRRGSDEDRKKVTLDIGEIGYVSDIASRRLFVGDGSTKGGNPAATKLYFGDFSSNPGSFSTSQVGDIIFNTVDSRLYALTGYDEFNFPNYSQPSSYAFIGARGDNSSIEYDSGGSLQVKLSGITNEHLADSVFNPQQGLKRSIPSGPLGVNVDNITLKINGSNQIYVDTFTLNLDQLNAVGARMNVSDIKFFNFLTADPAPFFPPGDAYGRLWVDGAGFLRVCLQL
jgi:hypothetical protein